MLLGIAAAGLLGCGLACLERTHPKLKLHNGTFTACETCDPPFDEMQVSIDGQSVVIEYPRGDRIVRVELKEVQR